MKRCTKCREEKVEGEFYLTTQRGKPCRGSKCKECEKIRIKEWKKRNSGKILATQRRWRKRNRFSKCLSQSKNAARRGGFVPCTATKEEIAKALTGICYVCGVSEIKCNRALHLDHNHETGKFRGWLCSNCNRAAGHLMDSPKLIRKLAEYIDTEGFCAAGKLDEV